VGDPAGCAGGSKDSLCSACPFAEHRPGCAGTDIAARAERRNAGNSNSAVSGRKNCAQPDAGLFGGTLKREGGSICEKKHIK